VVALLLVVQVLITRLILVLALVEEATTIAGCWLHAGAIIIHHQSPAAVIVIFLAMVVLH